MTGTRKIGIGLAALGAALAAAACAGSAMAQGRGPTITFYDLPNFQGPSRSFSATVENLADQGYNDRAQSARVQGRWRVCEDAHFRGRCVEVSGDVANLADLRMTVAISSFEALNRGGGYGNPGPGPGPGAGGIFGPGPGYGNGRPPYGQGGYNPPPPPPPPQGGQASWGGPSTEGRTVVFFPRPQPGPYRDANDFCRRMGLNGVVYADDRGSQLRDVVCRK